MNLSNQNLVKVSEELLTIRDYIRWGFSMFNAAHLFYGHGTHCALDEAVYLVLSALHLPPDISAEYIPSNLTIVERRNLCELISRRVNERIPAAYLTHEAWFAGLSFYIDERVLIPRSPIAELIETHFAPWSINVQYNHILDLCTGSGCIAIACALAFPGSEVDALDISKDALEVAGINVKKYELEDRVHLIESDLFAGLNKKYQLIVSNPPYVAQDEYESLPKEYRHEPPLALQAKEEGIAIIKKILKSAHQYLFAEGILVVEVGSAQQRLIDEYPQLPFLWLDFEAGGEGVFLLTAEQLQAHQHLF